MRVFMTGAGGGMGFESFRQMLPDLGKLYDLVLLDIMLQGQGTVQSQALIGGRIAINGSQADKLYLLHTAGGISHNLTGNIYDAVQHGAILAVVGRELRLA